MVASDRAQAAQAAWWRRSTPPPSGSKGIARKLNQAAGGVRAGSRRARVEKTNRIPLLSGNIMLMNYRVSNEGKEPRTLSTVTTYPPMVQPNGRTFTENRGAVDLRRGPGFAVSGQSYWTFDAKYSFEMVPGLWAFTHYIGQCLLIRKEFEAIKQQ